MKTLKFTVFSLLVSLFLLNSCKKGEEDPLLPFSTRDARITNNWKLTSSKSTVTLVNTFNKTKIDEFTFNGTTMSEYHIDYFDNVSEDSYPYSDSLIINKDGTYNQTIVINTSTKKIVSFWYWYDSNKNKIGINFEDGKIYLIQKLAKNELVLEYSNYSKETDENGNESTSLTEEIFYYSDY